MEENQNVDPEIVEIFIEEAGEVLETINEFFPQWSADYDNENSRVELRRAFHTLKGSGRMVQAYEIGELAWSIENMFNKLLDGNISASAPMVELVRQVIEMLPSMIECFSNGQPQTANVEPLMNAADQIAKGETPDLSSLQVSAAETAEVDTATESSSEAMDAFQNEINRQIRDVSGKVQQLSLAVKGVNEEIANLKVLVRGMESKLVTSVDPQEMRRDVTTVKQQVDNATAELQRVSSSVTQKISSVERELKSHVSKLDLQVNNVSNSLEKTESKVANSLNDTNGRVKVWAIGAATVAIAFSVAFTLMADKVM